MKKLLLLFFILSSLSIFCQKNNFKGSILYNDKKNKPCKLNIYIDSNYTLAGKLFREEKDKMVEHFITGDFDPNTQHVYFREYAISKSDCPIFFQGKISHIIQKIYAIAGLFQSQDSQRCSNGHLNVISENFNLNLYSAKKTVIQLSEKEEEKILSQILAKKTEKEQNFIQVKHDEKVNLQTSGDSIVIKVYDNQKVDGDRIKIVFNNTVVLDNFPLSNDQKTISVKPSKGKNLLKIYAVSEGRISMNTSKVEIYNHRFHEYFINVLQKNQFSTYEFIHQ